MGLFTGTAVWLLMMSNLLVLGGSTADHKSALPQVPKGMVKTLYGQGIIHSPEGNVIDYWRDLDGQVVRIKPLNISTESGVRELDVITIRQREGDLRPYGDLIPEASSSYVGFVPGVMSYVKNFVLQVYEEEGGPNAIAAVAKERDFYNGVSTMVVICEKNDLSKIRAVFRVVRRGNQPENKLLDVEVQQKLSLPEIKPEIVNVEGQRVAVGDWAELKTIAQDKKLGISLVPYLILALDENDYFAFNNRKIEINGETLALGANQLVLETDEPRKRYYESFGFRVDEEKSKFPIYVMAQSVEDFRKSFRILKRRAGENLSKYLEGTPRSAWNYLSIPTASSNRVESHPVPFYIQRPRARAPLRTEPVTFRVPVRVTYKIGWFATIHETQFRTVTEEPPKFHPDQDDLRVPPNPEPYHPFDFFQRLGLPSTADWQEIYWAYRQQGTKHSMNTLGWDPFAGRKIEEVYEGLGINAYVPPGGVHPREQHARKLREIYHQFGKEGFADPRYDPDPPLSSRSEHVRRILLNPERFFNEINSAVDESLQHREEDSRLDAALASIIKLPWNEVWDDWIERASANLERQGVDRRQARERVRRIVVEIIHKIERAFKLKRPTHPRAIERLLDHGRPTRIDFEILLERANIENVEELVRSSLYVGAFSEAIKKARDIVFRHRILDPISERELIEKFILAKDVGHEYSLKDLVSHFGLKGSLERAWPELNLALGFPPLKCSDQMRAIVLRAEPKNKIQIYQRNPGLMSPSTW